MFARRKVQGRTHEVRSDARQISRPGVEMLEVRVLLAGDVMVVPEGTPDSPGTPTTTLSINGDGLPNEIMIRRGSAPDEVIVNGLNGTLVNGSRQELHYQGVEQISVEMDGGADVVDVRNLELSSQFLALLSVDGGAGDDRITVFNMSINADTPLLGGSSVNVVLLGEIGALDTTGNDVIELTNTTIVADAPLVTPPLPKPPGPPDPPTPTASVSIFGERLSGGTVTGGNDNISVRNFDASGVGVANTVVLNVFGDGNFVTAPLLPDPPMGTIKGGNDTISLVNDDIAAVGVMGVATVMVFSDDRTGAENVTTVGEGDDDVLISNFLVEASTSSNMRVETGIGDDFVDIHNSEFGGLAVDTGSGDDELDILNSEWGSGTLDLRSGNDVLKLNGNSFADTLANGGDGYDILFAHNNTGVLLPVDFEEVNGMPSLL